MEGRKGKRKSFSFLRGRQVRRYYSVKEFLKSGVENVFKPIPPPKDDKRFYDSQNKWLIYNNDPLRKSIERFVRLPIATSL